MITLRCLKSTKKSRCLNLTQDSRAWPPPSPASYLATAVYTAGSGHTAISEASSPIAFSSHLDDNSTCTRTSSSIKSPIIHLLLASKKEHIYCVLCCVLITLRKIWYSRDGCVPFRLTLLPSLFFSVPQEPGPYALWVSLSSDSQWDLANGSHWKEFRKEDARELKYLFPNTPLPVCYGLSGSFYQKLQFLSGNPIPIATLSCLWDPLPLPAYLALLWQQQLLLATGHGVLLCPCLFLETLPRPCEQSLICFTNYPIRVGYLCPVGL